MDICKTTRMGQLRSTSVVIRSKRGSEVNTIHPIVTSHFVKATLRCARVAVTVESPTGKHAAAYPSNGLSDQGSGIVSACEKTTMEKLLDQEEPIKKSAPPVDSGEGQLLHQAAYGRRFDSDEALGELPRGAAKVTLTCAGVTG
ncbi:unnamed protein product [Haemonchus placei]|uniref:Kinesin motor domain-containing protein n=1 Tax=Haemonchus placei TaxID=6290 RepID=A0A0N4VTS1_HAEPC|nr:unnamed protein product [Haemonchus placei]